MKAFRIAALAPAVLVLSVTAAKADLYFSEYIEGSSNNKALEIYNGTGATVDLSSYEIRMYFNGSTSAGNTVPLAGVLADGEVYVVAQSAADPAIIAQADLTDGSGWFNGDDAVALTSSGVFIDVIGQVGVDPGSQWGTGDTSTQDNTLRRKESVSTGDPIDNDPFDPSGEWNGFPQNVFDGLGAYPDGGGSDPTELAVYEIQGAAHSSPVAGAFVKTTGIVTAVDFLGYYIQDASGDGDSATSDGIFVFVNGSAGVAVGDEVEVTGSVSEFFPGGVGTGNLSITEFVGPSTVVSSSGNSLPASTVIGQAGRNPPTEIVDDDLFADFDPNSDGIDFWESLEGMRVTVADARAVSPTNQFNEIYTVADLGVTATRINPRGGITIAVDDFNPERAQIQFDDDLLPGFEPAVDVGATLGDVTGVISYGFGNFEILPTEIFTPANGGLVPETSTLAGTPDALTIASYNVLNLDPKVEDPLLVSDPDDVDDDVGDGRFAAIAEQIVNALATPDIVGLQEIQDNDGGEQTGVVDATLTYQTLIGAIAAAGGPEYDFYDIAPVDGQDGGQPGGNIRVGFLYRTDRIAFVSGERIVDANPGDGDAFADSRKPLLARFTFGGEEIFVINNHFRSKGGSTPLFGAVQPPENGGVEERTLQAAEVNAVVDALLAADPGARVVVLGDINDFEFEAPLIALAGPEPALHNLTLDLPELDRYTFQFNGNSQALDHVLVSDALRPVAEYDIVHANVEFNMRTSDHEPLLVRLALGAPDSDGDGVADNADNCTAVANADQRDLDGDGIGSICDGDFDNDCQQNFLDLAGLKKFFFDEGDLNTDMNGDAKTNFLDLGLFKEIIFTPPGPSGVPNVCD